MPLCGDGTKILPEECDDGNLSAGDGCDANCAIEEGFGPNGLENIPPEFKLGDVASDNSQIVLTFSETVIPNKDISGLDFKLYLMSEGSNVLTAWRAASFPESSTPFQCIIFRISGISGSVAGTGSYF